MMLHRISSLILLIIILVAGYMIPFAAPQEGPVTMSSGRLGEVHGPVTMSSRRLLAASHGTVMTANGPLPMVHG
ncbi:hypothetical protein LguiA_004700 [Lonicera macranthoides]